MRAGMIGIGSVALREFHGILLVFAGILIYSSYSALAEAISNFNEDDNDDDGEEKEDMGENKIVQFSRNLLDASDTFDGDRFFTIEEGVKRATPLLICMVAVEISDVVFAVDSIPAVFGVTEVRTYINEIESHASCIISSSSPWFMVHVAPMRNQIQQHL